MDSFLGSPEGHTPGSDRRDGSTAISHTAGRALTPRDLAAQRGYFEACAFLSAEAALLAVLVARIGELEQILIHPGDLVEDLSRRLDWRDVPDELRPKRVGVWLRSLGFFPVGRDRLGVTYEIHWEQLWQLDPREVSAPDEGLDPFALEGTELLRLLAHEQHLFFAPRVWCPTCQRLVATVWGDLAEKRGELWPCPTCGSTTRLLDDTWLVWASDRIRNTILKDRNLLPRIKAEWKDLHDGATFPRLPEPFEWLNAAWQKAGRPRGRPTAVRERYELAHAVEQLECARVSKSDIEDIFQARGKRRQVLYNELPAYVHRFLGCTEGFAVDLPSVKPRTLWVDVQWARRQWTNPRSRLRGEGTFPAAIPKETIGMEARSASAYLSPPEPTSKMREVCPKCGNNVLETLDDESLQWSRCRICGWRARMA